MQLAQESFDMSDGRKVEGWAAGKAASIASGGQVSKVSLRACHLELRKLPYLRYSLMLP